MRRTSGIKRVAARAAFARESAMPNKEIMKLRELGSTGLRVSPIGLGMAALGRPGYITLGHAADLGRAYAPEAMQARAEAVLDAAWAAGIRYYDAARSYGRGEDFLGAWLRSRSVEPAAVCVGSKWGYTYTADWRVEAEVHEVKDHSLAVLQRQWQESSRNLCPYLRLYQIHSATLESGVLGNLPVFKELARLKAEGTAIGLTLSGVDQAEVLRRAMTLRIEGVRMFDCVQATWNLLEPSVGSELAAARHEGIGVIVKEALANGRLAGRDHRLAAKASTLEREARRLDATVDALALAAALAQPWADVVLSGAVSVAQLATNVRALDVRWDDQAWTALAGLAEEPAAYWKERSRLAWN
jgi:aryl-alcohol dehydrogenase-like predicted oxidoreductase